MLAPPFQRVAMPAHYRFVTRMRPGLENKAYIMGGGARGRKAPETPKEG